MRAEGVSFRHAVELLASGQWKASNTAAKIIHGAEAGAADQREADDAKVLLQVVDYYHETLKESPEALAYLRSAGSRIRR